MARPIARWLLAAPLLGMAAPAARADVYLGIGAAIIHSEGVAWQAAVEVAPKIELHFSTWRDGERHDAVGVSYRLRDGHGVSVVLGVAYIGQLSDNLLDRADAYIEIRFAPRKHVSCQISHYSTIGDDRGENFLLCGAHARLAPLLGAARASRGG